MKLKDVTTFLDKKNTSGATLDELKNELGDEDMDTLHRLLQAGMDWGDIKKDGKGRGLRYYDSKYEIVKILPIVARQKHVNRVEDIDISNCLTVKDRIATVLASSFRLTQLHKFSYRDKLNEPEINRNLYDFIHPLLCSIF